MMLFDQPYYLDINEARWNAVQEILAGVRRVNGNSCLDVGCGPGWFSQKLVAAGFSVTGIDGRPELIAEARARAPGAEFTTLDVQSAEAMSRLSPLDLVLCFGLLYHVENPFRVIRNIAAVTRNVLLLESVVVPGQQADAVLVEEGRNETQGLTYHAMILSRPALVKMLYLAGFEHVFRFTGAVEHEDFRESAEKFKRREIYICTRIEFHLPFLLREDVPRTPKYSFSKVGEGGQR